MHIERHHERRYYRHKGDWYIGFGRSYRVWFRIAISTPRHRLNMEIWRGANRPWRKEADRMRVVR